MAAARAQARRLRSVAWPEREGGRGAGRIGVASGGHRRLHRGATQHLGHAQRQRESRLLTGGQRCLGVTRALHQPQRLRGAGPAARERDARRGTARGQRVADAKR
jgi:hypothetical protein